MNAARSQPRGFLVGSPEHFALAFIALATLLVGGVSCSKAPEPERKVKMYQSPMHPWITSEKPSNCTICGMELVPVYEGESGREVDPGIVALNPRSVDVLAVTTVPVRRLDLTKSLRFSGILEDDENIHRIIAAFYDGRIDEIFVQHVGQYVEKGQPLAAIYSPELLYVVREYQNATRSGDPAVARNAAQRLVQYGLSAEQVSALAKQPDNVYTINLLAPISGTVLIKKAFKGQYIKTGEPLFEMGNLSRLWFHAEVYERDLPDIRLGQKATLTTPTVPGREFEGTVTFIDPNFDARTRSTKVRMMLSTGIRAQVGIKVLGSDLETIQQVALKIEDLVRQVPDAMGVAASRTQGKPYMEILPDRLALARYGLSIRDLMDVVEIGLGGLNVSTTIEGRARYPIQLRLARDEREDIEQLGSILIPTREGFSVPLGQVASVRRSSGASEIASEDGLLRVFVQSNVHGRDLGGFVREVQKRIAKAIDLPPGVTLKWSGQYESQLSAQRTLMLIVPVVLLIIFMLLTVVFRSIMEAAHVILAVPFALTGGALLQYLLGYNFSVAVWIGYIALFGTAIQTGVVMVVYLEEALKRKRDEKGPDFNLQDLRSAVLEGAMLRLRPKVMTVSTVIASLLPIMWSTRTGAEVMKPLATPVIGGMLSSLLHVSLSHP